MVVDRLRPGFIYIPSEATETAKPRSIPMNQVVRELLMDLKGSRGRSEAVTSPKTDDLLTDIKHGFVHACDDAETRTFGSTIFLTKQLRGWLMPAPMRLSSLRYSVTQI